MPTPLGFSLFDGQPEGVEIALALAVAVHRRVAGRSTAVVATGPAAAAVDLRRAAIELPRLAAQPVLRHRDWSRSSSPFAVTAVPLLDGIGQRLDVGLDGRSVLQWALGSGPPHRDHRHHRLAARAHRLGVNRAARAGSGARQPDRDRRAPEARPDPRRRWSGTSRSTLVVTVALLMILRELNVDILPMLTGAGIAGVALGFGAQWLVRDLIAGFFLILEDQVRVGDSVVINGQGGSVEAINLRTIVLRDVEGAVHIVPNGAITTLANRSRDFAYYLIDLNLDFRQDTDRVVQILRDTAATLQGDDALQGCDPRAARSPRRRVVQGRPGRDPVAAEDPAAAAVRGRPRAAPPPALCPRSGRHRATRGGDPRDTQLAQAIAAAFTVGTDPQISTDFQIVG